ncbi:hypothetical protein VNI00_005455 [Paramarasmius palmivorus]|uniref:Uncharacterized protein n=1 Tax=Paramarasmius palmivorus TaxID=297713 RepID=A0AAW0DBL2_9AGAR
MNLPQNIRVPPSYLSLKARVPEIKRPYFSQAVMAVRICEALVMKLGALENQHDAAQLLETTFQLVQAALDKAAGAKKKQDQGITSEISENIAASFERAQKSLEKCFVSFQINEQWATWQGRIQTSKARDEDRSSALEGCLEKSSSFHRENPFKEDEKVEIDLTVKDSWEVIYSRKVTYNISTSSQLGCLLSMEASRERTHYERISSMKTFFTSMAGQRYDLHTKISDIPPNDLKVRSLTLMLCD